MSEDFVKPLRTSYISSVITLFASSSTLICCALPALLVAIGAGAALSSLVASFPQIVWISENKELVFTFSTIMMILSGVLQWKNRHAPCPTDPRLRDACLRSRQISKNIYLVSLVILAVGTWFAFIQPWLNS